MRSVEYFPVLHTSRSVEYGFFTKCGVRVLQSVEYGFFEVWSTGFYFAKCGVRVFGTGKYSADCLLLELMYIYGNDCIREINRKKLLMKFHTPKKKYN